MTKIFILLLYVSLLYSQGNYNVEWDTPSGNTGSGFINSMESNNNVKELMVINFPNILIYDGASHNLKYSYTSNDSSYFNIPHTQTNNYFFDVNNDNIVDIVSYKAVSYPIRNLTVRIINGLNGQTLWQNNYNNYSGYPSVSDIDDDGFLELLISLYDGTNYKWQVISTPSHVIGIENNQSIIKEYQLNQNYPNPFNPNTKIEFSVSKSSFVEIRIFNILGEEIEMLVNEEKPAGTHIIDFNGLNFASGAYFYQISVNGIAESKKMILLK